MEEEKEKIEKVDSLIIQKNKKIIYEIPKIRVEIQIKAVVLGILLFRLLELQLMKE